MKSISFNLMLVLFLTTVFAPHLYSQATTGKIMGQVVDRETKEPLIGANVIVEGTYLGASTDVDGYYVILNVPPGEYTVSVHYVGYQVVSVENVKVSAGFTTTQNFEIAVEAIEIEPVVVTAERSMVPRDQAGTVRMITDEQIQTLPIRQFVDIAATTAGVVQDERGGSVNIRGGRSDETAYIIDGVWTNDPLTGTSSAVMSQRALDELVVMTGGYSAEYGNVMSGVVNITTKSGSEDYKGAFEYVTDEFLGEGVENLRSMGSTVANFSLSGPVLPNNRRLLQFYGLIEYSFDRDYGPSWYSEYHRDKANEIWDEFTDYALSVYQQRHNVAGTGIELTRDMLGMTEPSWNSVQPGQIPTASRRRIAWNEKITLNLKNFRVFLGGISSRTESRPRVASYLLANSDRNPLRYQDTDQYSMRITWAPAPSTFMEGQVSWYRSFQEDMDPIHGDNLFAYGDTLTNPLVKMYYPTPGEGQGQRVPFDPILSQFALPGRIYNFYGINNTTFWQFNYNLTHQFRRHEIKLGAELRTHELRKYRINPLSLVTMEDDLIAKVKANPDQLTPDERELVLATYRSSFTEAYGYDMFGREIEQDGFDPEFRTEGAKKPLFGAVYLQDKIELQDFVINAGLRFDYWDANTRVLRDLNDVTNSLGHDGIAGTADDGNPNTLEEDSFEDVEVFTRLSPRLGFAFPVTERMVFYAQYGIFSQMPPLERLYASREWLHYWLLESSVFTTFANPRLQPERTVQYEFGVRQQLGDYASVNITAQYKEINDLIQSNLIFSPHNPTGFSVYDNTDYATVRGVDFTFDLRRWRNLAASINYSLQYATGTGSDAATQFTISWLNLDRPKFESPLEFDQRHTLSAVLDYRWGQVAPHPILSRLGINVLTQINSGRPYTLNDPEQRPEPRGAGNVVYTRSPINGVYWGWNYKVDLRLDKVFSIDRFDIELYALVSNVFNRKNISDVWNTSGKPDDTGYLNTEPGRAGLEQVDPEIRDIYMALWDLYEKDLFNVGHPRQFRLGIQFRF